MTNPTQKLTIEDIDTIVDWLLGKSSPIEINTPCEWYSFTNSEDALKITHSLDSKYAIIAIGKRQKRRIRGKRRRL